MKLPRSLWITAGVVFAAATIWIHYQVKVLMVSADVTDLRARKTATLQVGSVAPEFSVRDLANAAVKLSDYRGKKVVLIDFWATWCGPCRMSMPYLQNMMAELKDPNFEVLSVDQGEAAPKVAAFAAAEKYPFHFALDPDSTVGAAYGVRSIPTQILVDKQGVVRWVRVGYTGNDQALKKMIKLLSRETSS